MTTIVKPSFLLDYIVITISIVLLGALAGVGPMSMVSYLAGSVFFGINFFLLSIAWRMIISKKLVALAILIIVIKYALLVVGVYFLMQKSWMQPLYFIGSLAIIMLAAVSYTLRNHGV